MRWGYNLERSYVAAVWLSLVALLVVLMVIVGGATRLTGSGLSITEWKPLSGILPPLSAHGWDVEFAHYRQISQYRLVNNGLSLHAFKSLYWWEWAHRLLARIVVAVVVIPMAVLLISRRLPRRLIWRCGVLLAVLALEPLVGWAMVASGLEKNRIAVAPELLATHLLIALLILAVCIWTALEAWYGRSRATFGADRRLAAGSVALVAASFVQVMLGALVAGNQAGRLYTDWPLMDGAIVPKAYAPKHAGLWDILAHSPAAVQFDHRIGGYVLFLLAWVFAAVALRTQRAPGALKGLFVGLAAMVTLQAVLGIVTLHYAAPLGLSLAHQIGAVAVLSTAVVLAWRVQRN